MLIDPLSLAASILRYLLRTWNWRRVEIRDFLQKQKKGPCPAFRQPLTSLGGASGWVHALRSTEGVVTKGTSDEATK
jgi:hypothetical protein